MLPGALIRLTSYEGKSRLPAYFAHPAAVSARPADATMAGAPAGRSGARLAAALWADGGGDQGVVRPPQSQDVSDSRRKMPLIEPPGRFFVRVAEDHLGVLAVRSPAEMVRDTILAAFFHHFLPVTVLPMTLYGGRAGSPIRLF